METLREIIDYSTFFNTKPKQISCTIEWKKRWITVECNWPKSELVLDMCESTYKFTRISIYTLNKLHESSVFDMNMAMELFL